METKINIDAIPDEIGNKFKTINGESLVGEGDITISSGGEDIRYFTEFTVEQIADANSYEVNNLALIDAMENNKLICIPYKDGEQGFVVASSDNYLSKISFVYGSIFYNISVAPIQLLIKRTAFIRRTVNIEPSQLDLIDDNTDYNLSDSTTAVYISLNGILNVGSIIRFTAGDDCIIRAVGSLDIKWANGVMPTIESGVTYELSMVSFGTMRNLLAVLTPFKPVE